MIKNNSSNKTTKELVDIVLAYIKKIFIRVIILVVVILISVIVKMCTIANIMQITSENDVEAKSNSVTRQDDIKKQLEKYTMPIFKRECEFANTQKANTKIECIGVTLGEKDLSILVENQFLEGGPTFADFDSKAMVNSSCSNENIKLLLTRIDYFNFVYYSFDKSDRLEIKIDKDSCT